MTTTITETKKTTLALIREYKNKFITAWPCILLFFFVYLHILLIKILPSSSELVNVWTASLYQIIGAGCVLYQINGSLKILKGDDLIKSIKQYLGSWPKRIVQNRIINLKTGIINCSATTSANITIQSNSETIEEKIERLSKRVDEINKKINRDRQEVMCKINKNQEKNDKRLSVVNKEIQKLKTNLEGTIVGDYKTAIFGVLMIIYGIVIPIISLYT